MASHAMAPKAPGPGARMPGPGDPPGPDVGPHPPRPLEPPGPGGPRGPGGPIARAQERAGRWGVGASPAGSIPAGRTRSPRPGLK